MRASIILVALAAMLVVSVHAQDCSFSVDGGICDYFPIPGVSDGVCVNGQCEQPCGDFQDSCTFGYVDGSGQCTTFVTNDGTTCTGDGIAVGICYQGTCRDVCTQSQCTLSLFGDDLNCFSVDFLKDGQSCSVGPCATGGQCSGGSCNPTGFRSNQFVCRAANPCHDATTCTGNSQACPPDDESQVGQQCFSDNNACVYGICVDGGVQVTCNFNQGGTTTCPQPSNNCQYAECDPNDGQCKNINRGTNYVCREKNGVCDVAETCPDNQGSPCGPDVFASSSTECRRSEGDCDPAEFCSGNSRNCPADALYGPETTCREPTDLCDAPEVCSGGSVTCPADQVRPSSYICREGSGDLCDPDEKCTGASKACPADVIKPDGFVCREGGGSPNGGLECNPSETCSGVAGEACPSDVCDFGIQCRPAVGQCDLPESCGTLQDCLDGTNVCPVNAFKPSTARCDDNDNNECTAGFCAGDSGDCNPTPLPDGTQCQDACGQDARCVSVQCLCYCSVDCVLTRGAVAQNSPSGNRKGIYDPVWALGDLATASACGLSADEFFDAKGNKVKPQGCEGDLLAQYYTVLYNVDRYRLSQDVQCSGVADAPAVQQIVDWMKSLLAGDTTAFCAGQFDDNQCAYNVSILKNWNEGQGDTIEHCDANPITLSNSVDNNGGGHHGHHNDNDKREKRQSTLLIVILVFVLIGVVLLCVLILLRLMESAANNQPQQPSSSPTPTNPSGAAYAPVSSSSGAF